MSIDTQNKRRSALGCGIQVFTVYPVADEEVDVFDRRHACAQYAGIEAQNKPYFFWLEDDDGASQWCQDQSLTPVLVSNSTVTSTWSTKSASTLSTVKSGSVSSTWVKKTETRDS